MLSESQRQNETSQTQLLADSGSATDKQLSLRQQQRRKNKALQRLFDEQLQLHLAKKQPDTSQASADVPSEATQEHLHPLNGKLKQMLD